jgi:hypothetical protein
VKRVKFRIPTWESGREFMNQIAKELDAEIEVRDAKLIISDDEVEIRFHPDDRGFAFITCKIYNESVEPTLNHYIELYKK